AVNERFRTPHWALVFGGVVGILTLFTGTTDKIIILSALGAVILYMISMISLFKLRRSNPNLERPFKAPMYPVFPIIALVISSLCLIAIVYYNLLLSGLFLAGFFVTWVVFRVTGTRKEKMEQDEMLGRAV